MNKGRKRESAEILEFKGKSHKTKEELNLRRKERLILGDTNFVAPKFITTNRIALAKWNTIIDLYESVPRLKGHITTAMQDQLSTYCILYSSQLKTIKELKRARGIEFATLNNSLLKTSNEMNKLGKDLLLDFFVQAKVSIPQKENPVDPLEEEGFGNI
jgi:phage terminase small subunit